LLMKTFYDVLNVCADDDAESVKKAFREAVKASHPDLNAGDPDALSRFVQIVRANAVLRDPKLRAIYDRMLEVKRRQHRQSKLVAIFNTARSVTARAIIGFVLAFVIVEGYGVFTYRSEAFDVAVRVSGAIPPLAPVDATGQLKAVGLPKSAAPVLEASVDAATDAKTVVDAAPGRPKGTGALPPGDVETDRDRANACQTAVRTAFRHHAQRVLRRRRRHRLAASLQTRLRGDRVEAARVALPLWPIQEPLAQDQEPSSAGSEVRSRGSESMSCQSSPLCLPSRGTQNEPDDE
jgi:curved DNA-binding protein CbpA